MEVCASIFYRDVLHIIYIYRSTMRIKGILLFSFFPFFFFFVITVDPARTCEPLVASRLRKA